MNHSPPFAVCHGEFRDRNFQIFTPEIRFVPLHQSFPEAHLLPIVELPELPLSPSDLEALEHWFERRKPFGLSLGFYAHDGEWNREAEACNRLFYHISTVSRKEFREFENLVLLEPFRSLRGFHAGSLRRAFHSLRSFFTHPLGNRVPVCYFLDRGEVEPELQYELRKFGFLSIFRLQERADHLLRIPLPKGSSSPILQADARECDGGLFRPLTFISLGKQKIAVLGAAEKTEIRILSSKDRNVSPPSVRVIRPSLRSPVNLRDHGFRGDVFSIFPGNCLEITEGEKTLGLVLCGRLRECPAGFTRRAPGQGASVIPAGSRIFFEPGLHLISAAELQIAGDCKLIFAAGAVGDFRLSARQVENLEITGMTVLSAEFQGCSCLHLVDCFFGDLVFTDCCNVDAEQCTVGEPGIPQKEPEPCRGAIRLRKIVLLGGSPDALFPGNIGQRKSAELQFDTLEWIAGSSPHRIFSLRGASYHNVFVESAGELNFVVEAWRELPEKTELSVDGCLLSGKLPGVRLNGFVFSETCGLGGLRLKNVALVEKDGYRRLRDLSRKEFRMGEDFFELRSFFEEE